MIALARNRDLFSRRTFVTAEGLVMPVVLGSRGARVTALVLDLIAMALIMGGSTLLLILLAAGVSSATGQAMESADGPLHQLFEVLAVLWFALMFLFRHGYFLYFELGPRAATPGKRASQLRVAARPIAGQEGRRLTVEMVLARNLIRDIELFLPLALVFERMSEANWDLTAWVATGWFLLFALFPLFNRDRLRAGDLIAGTWVIEDPRGKLASVLSTGAPAARGASPATGAEYRFSEAELAIYGEYELQTLERVLRDGRPEALAAVQEAICRKIGWEPGAGDERAFLEAYYTQLRARLEGGLRMGRRKADKFG